MMAEYSSTPTSLNKLASSCPKKQAGRKKFKETRHPVYHRVRRRNNDRWVCELRAPHNKTARTWLGTYATAEMAARAHDVAALALKGRMTCLNFADSPTRLRVPSSGDIRDIQRAAAEAAEAFGVEREPVQLENDGSGYVDEETLRMPRLLAHMAEGMLMSPPRHCEGFGWDEMEDGESEVTLWSFSM